MKLFSASLVIFCFVTVLLVVKKPPTVTCLTVYFLLILFLGIRWVAYGNVPLTEMHKSNESNVQKFVRKIYPYDLSILLIAIIHVLNS